MQKISNCAKVSYRYQSILQMHQTHTECAAELEQPKCNEMTDNEPVCLRACLPAKLASNS